MTSIEMPRAEVIALLASKPENTRTPWLYESDIMAWTDVETGLKCLIRRVPGMGHLCGYVRIMRGHPFYGKDAQRIKLEVHGGVAVARRVYDKRWMRRGYWVGFECAHLNDLVPMYKTSKYLNAILGAPPMLARGTYRDMQFVYRETTHLAQQLKLKAQLRAAGGKR